ncbi:hypothetical protein [Szabonella alba]|uniref:Uncharacterized protein n=1 Tax=Szabonella alba TaxID=2804194 RepID=A0A8K0Y258_9RHOB|nr:hypothetical protein [Szabonella alba]MBL4918782.1 hypothetical protein [Szabonella alba]
MIALYLLAGTTGGFLGFAAAILLGTSIMAAFALYFLGGVAMIGLTVTLRLLLTAERAEPVGQTQDA